MKNRKTWIAALMALITAFACAGCGNELTREDVEDRYGRYIEVSYDIGPGVWDNNPTRQVTHRYAPADGGVLLYMPGSSKLNKANAEYNGHFIEGWYTDAEFTHKWNFATDRATESLKLYANWLPHFKYTFYYKDDDGKEVALNSINVAQGGLLPTTARPTRTGYTFLGTLYKDKECTLPWVFTEPHIGTIENGVQSNVEVPVYTTWLEGEYTLVSAADDLNSLGNLYVLPSAVESGIDCEVREEDGTSYYTWTGVHGEFTGAFEGNGVTIRNIVFDAIGIGAGNQLYGGLFDKIGSTAVMRNVTFDNVTMIVDDVADFRRSFGLFAGAIEKGATFENVVVNGTIRFKNVSTNATNVYKLLAEYIETINGEDSELDISTLKGITYHIDVECDDGFGYTVTKDADGNTLHVVPKA